MRLGYRLCYAIPSHLCRMLNRVLLSFCSSTLEMARLLPGSWEGSDVRKEDIDWLIRSRRVVPEVICRLPGKEHVPTPQAGERVIFLTHFERGFGLPASNFFRSFLDFFGLQPHHLPANAIVSLSAYSAFMEGYLGLWPTVEVWAKFLHLRK